MLFTNKNLLSFIIQFFYYFQIQVVNGAILISWRQKVLERQIDYGAKLGQVVLSLARMELNNFFKNVMPVADYFDQSNMLIAVSDYKHLFLLETIDLLFILNAKLNRIQ